MTETFCIQKSWIYTCTIMVAIIEYIPYLTETHCSPFFIVCVCASALLGQCTAPHVAHGLIGAQGQSPKKEAASVKSKSQQPLRKVCSLLFRNQEKLLQNVVK